MASLSHSKTINLTYRKEKLFQIMLPFVYDGKQNFVRNRWKALKTIYGKQNLLLFHVCNARESTLPILQITRLNYIEITSLNYRWLNNYCFDTFAQCYISLFTRMNALFNDATVVHQRKCCVAPSVHFYCVWCQSIVNHLFG